MNDLQITRNPIVEDVFSAYPDDVKDQMIKLRKLVFDTAKEIDHVNAIEETLKWGEPSYLTKIGSTLRMD